jgi:hypothetical protein
MKLGDIKGEVIGRYDGALPVSDFTTLAGPALVGCSLVNPDEICGSLVFRTTAAGGSESLSFNYEEITTGLMGSTTSFFAPGTFSRFGTFTSQDGNATLTISPVPEAATWLMLIIGFGLVGAKLRRRQTVVAA